MFKFFTFVIPIMLVMILSYQVSGGASTLCQDLFKPQASAINLSLKERLSQMDLESFSPKVLDINQLILKPENVKYSDFLRFPLADNLASSKSYLDYWPGTKKMIMRINGDFPIAVTPEQFAAFRKYTGNGFYPLNNYLKHDIVEHNWNKSKLIRFKNNMIDAWPILNRYSGISYRGIAFHKSNIPDFKKGQIVESPSFTSTSTLREVAETYLQNSSDYQNVLFIIKSSLNGVDLWAHRLSSTNEGEILFPPGTKFKISSAPSKDGEILIVHLQEEIM